MDVNKNSKFQKRLKELKEGKDINDKINKDYEKELIQEIVKGFENEIWTNTFYDMTINDKILEWAKERGILIPDNATKQMLKLTEEVGELAGAIAKNNKTDQIDAIGDIQVVLIILSEQLGINYKEALESAYNVIKNRTGKTINGVFIKD